MPDSRRHRGPHPEDRQLFRDMQQVKLRAATDDLCWLFTRGYASRSALKLVGDRYDLVERQRTAIARCACSDQALARRQQHQRRASEVAGSELWIDGFNLLTSVEAALSGGVILSCRDGCYRDMASMHGSYRKVAETLPAIRLVGELLARFAPAKCLWLLDQPVSNSGRLRSMLQSMGEQHGWHWQSELVADPDRLLIDCEHVVATSDSGILDRTQVWISLARLVIEAKVPTAWIVDLPG